MLTVIYDVGEVMIYQLVDRVQGHLYKYYKFNEVEGAKLRYSLEVILGELSKSLLLFLFFSLFKAQWDALFCMVTLSALRSYTGGLHFKTYSTCLLVTGFFIGVVIGFQHFIPISHNLFTISFIFTFLVISFFAPITSKNRPNYSKKKRMKFKITALLVLTSYFVLFVVTKESTIFSLAIWVAILQSIQLIITKGVQYYEKHLQKNN